MEKGHAEEVEGVLALEGLRLRVLLGALPEEVVAPRAVELDVRVPQLPEAGKMIDYASIAEKLAELEGGEFGYVEDLAAAAADLLLAGWPSRRWTVSVVKHSPPVAVPLRIARYTLSRGPVV